jgi:hypothetical protein
MKLLRFAGVAMLAILFIACDKENHDGHEHTKDKSKFLGLWESVSLLLPVSADTVWTPIHVTERNFYGFYPNGRICYRWMGDTAWGTYEIKEVGENRYSLTYRPDDVNKHDEIKGGVFSFYKEGDIVFWSDNHPGQNDIVPRYKRK